METKEDKTMKIAVFLIGLFLLGSGIGKTLANGHVLYLSWMLPGIAFIILSMEKKQ